MSANNYYQGPPPPQGGYYPQQPQPVRPNLSHPALTGRDVVVIVVAVVEALIPFALASPPPQNARLPIARDPALRSASRARVREKKTSFSRRPQNFLQPSPPSCLAPRARPQNTKETPFLFLFFFADLGSPCPPPPGLRSSSPPGLLPAPGPAHVPAAGAPAAPEEGPQQLLDGLPGRAVLLLRVRGRLRVLRRLLRALLVK